MKDFDNWNNQKKKIDEIKENKYYHPRDIWWCRLGLNVGFEQDGKDKEYERPVVVLNSFGPNICLVVPLTTSSHLHKYRIPIGVVDNQNATAILSQIKVIDTKRFVEKIGVINKDMFVKIQKRIREFF